MAKQLESINQDLQDFIKNQHIFFVATAAEEGRVNLSPKGCDSFRVINEHKIVWLNLTGSGNETAAHLLKNPRMTIMFCAFEGDPIILRLYGTAKVYGTESENWNDLVRLFPKIAGSRQLVDVDVQNVQISCGMGVPLMDYQSQRKGLLDWAEKQGDEGLEKYWQKKNTTSIDGFKAKK